MTGTPAADCELGPCHWKELAHRPDPVVQSASVQQSREKAWEWVWMGKLLLTIGLVFPEKPSILTKILTDWLVLFFFVFKEI